MGIIASLIKRDVLLAFRKGGDVGQVAAFYMMVSTLFIFGIGPSVTNTTLIAPAVIWVCALLVQSISVNKIFAEDFEDGTLEQLILQGDLPEKIIFARMFSNWLTGGFLLIIFSPVLAILFGMGWPLIFKLQISLLCGTPILSIISVAIAAVTLGIRKGGVIFSVLAFPLYIPVLIFGASWVSGADSFTNNMLLLLAIFLVMLPVCVAAAVISIKAAFSEN